MATENPAGCSPFNPTTSCPVPTGLTTVVSYNSGGLVDSVTEPESEMGVTTTRSYSYCTAPTPPPPPATPPPPGCLDSLNGQDYPNVTTVDLTGMSGAYEATAYNSSDQVIATTDSTGQTTSTAWDSLDRPVESLSPTGLETTTAYDLNSNVTDTYGPAPQACFGSNYLPVASPGCSVAVPHKHNGYDEGLTGFAASFYNNPYLDGKPVIQETGIGGTSLGGVTPKYLGQWGCSSAGDACTQWTAVPSQVGSSTTQGAPGQLQWSVRLTGTVDLPGTATSGWQIGAFTTTLANVYVDGKFDAQADQTGGVGTNYGSGGWVNDGAVGYNTFGSGVHTVEIDFFGTDYQGYSNGVGLAITQPGAQSYTESIAPVTDTAPNYGLQTSTTDADGVTTQTQYNGGGLDPEYGLTTATIKDPNGTHPLVTTTTYEPPGIGFLRRLSTTLPGDQSPANPTTYQYYTTGAEAPLTDPSTGNPACGLSSSTNEGGQLMAQIDPAPGASGSPREQQFVYNNAGQLAGRRVNTKSAINKTAWQCITYDSAGKMLSESWPSYTPTPGATPVPARAVTFHYDVNQNPLTASVTDTATGEAVTSTIDLLGRVWTYTDASGTTTGTTYDNAGRVSSVGTVDPLGTSTSFVLNDYDPITGVLTSVGAQGPFGTETLATPTYDGYGRLQTVAYNNGTTLTVGYNANYGYETSLSFTDTSSGQFVAGSTITKSLAGRITNSTYDNGTAAVDPNPNAATDFTFNSPGVDYTYDGAGRLVTAALDGETASYSYAANTACTLAPNAGANTNRTSVTTTPTTGTATTTSSCYNGADQLTSTTTGSTTTSGYTYDPHGNQLTDGTTTYTYDASDQLTGDASPAGTITYTRDPVSRLLTRTEGSTTTDYAYSGYTDSPTAVVTPTGAFSQAFVSLPGGVTVTLQTRNPTSTWSYPDLLGNNIATASSAGTLSSTTNYDPWGAGYTTSTLRSNIAGGAQLDAYGADAKLTETGGTTDLVLMGARGFDPAEARFLSVDPIQGGCANGYTYSFGDPLNNPDLSGRQGCHNKTGGGINCGWGNCTLYLGISETKAIASWLEGTGGSTGYGGVVVGGIGTATTAGLIAGITTYLGSDALTAVGTAVLGGFAAVIGIAAAFYAQYVVNAIETAAARSQTFEWRSDGPAFGNNSPKCSDNLVSWG